MKKFMITAMIFIAGVVFLRGSATEAEKNTTWEIYRSEKVGYEIIYPQGWEVIEAKPRTGNKVEWAGNILIDSETEKVTFREKEDNYCPGEFQIRVLINPQKLNFEKWIQQNEPQDVSGGSLIQDISDMVLDGKPAKKLSIFGFDQEIIEIIVIRGGSVYSMVFSGENPNNPKIKEHNKIYEKMFLSFRFIKK